MNNIYNSNKNNNACSTEKSNPPLGNNAGKSKRDCEVTAKLWTRAVKCVIPFSCDC